MPPSTERLLRELLARVNDELPDALALRRRLHAEPELSHAEHATSALIAEQLPLASEPLAGTGRIARIGPAGGAAVGVRAELDALPLRERTGAPFSAGGEAMHACGHDVHMAALVALARAAQRLGDDLPVALLAVFQPSEEAYPSGAELLARELARAKPAAMLAAHVHPELAWGSVALDAGAVNASSDSVEITIDGQPSHAAYPHRGRDPVLAISQVVVALHARAARAIDPLSPATLNVGIVQAGAIETAIPSRARARASLRAYRDADRETLRELVAEVVAGVAAAHGCRGTVELIAGEPPLVNDSSIVANARELLAGAGLQLAPPWRSLGSDDFAFFGQLAPLAMAFVGLAGAPGFAERPLHHPELLPPEESVAAIARTHALLLVAATRTLGATG
jgi:amidohydrolase